MYSPIVDEFFCLIEIFFFGCIALFYLMPLRILRILSDASYNFLPVRSEKGATGKKIVVAVCGSLFAASEAREVLFR